MQSEKIINNLKKINYKKIKDHQKNSPNTSNLYKNNSKSSTMKSVLNYFKLLSINHPQFKKKRNKKKLFTNKDKLTLKRLILTNGKRKILS
jgi:hypothetical protein